MLSWLGGTLFKSFFSISFRNQFKQFLHQTHYDVLGLSRNCSKQDVKEAFIKLSKRYHPDRNARNKSHGQFVKVLEAYNVLSKPDKRRLYDWELTHKPSYRYTNDFHPPSRRPKPAPGRARGFSYDDPSFWANRDKSQDKYHDTSNNYYGVPGIRRVSNGVVAIICVLFTTVGVTLQYLAIRHSTTLRRDVMAQQTLENQEILTKIQDEATKNGNELQIELMERRLLKDRFYTQFDAKKT